MFVNLTFINLSMPSLHFPKPPSSLDKAYQSFMHISPMSLCFMVVLYVRVLAGPGQISKSLTLHTTNLMASYTQVTLLVGQGWQEKTVSKGRTTLASGFFYFNNFYYQDKVTVTMKGLELELVKILEVFASIDFSSNNFVGAIPETIGDLRSLYVLNLSHNALTGSIPKSIGMLKQLGSLDLSSNHLTGKIPKELASLTFLSVLNLAYNKLYGMIPTGTQLQSFPSTSYEGNRGLCGPPLNESCDSNEFASNLVIGSKVKLNWQLLITGSGFVVGVALIVAPLLFCKRWRQHYEKQVDRCLKLIIPGYGSC